MVHLHSMTRAARNAWPIPARAGIGLRLPHHAEAAQTRAADWLEVHPENYMASEPAARELERIRAHHALSLHGVGLSLGSADGLDRRHLERLGETIARFAPGLVSDHLSWSGIGGMHFPDLLPLPYSAEALEVVTRNVMTAQDALKRPLLIENPSVYVRLPGAVMSEAQFLGELVRRTGCGVLLDLNNIQVSARNLGADPAQALQDCLREIPGEVIGEIHLAGHQVQKLDGGGEIRIDDHGSPVCAAVWRLYETAIHALGARPTLIEWDTAIPPLGVLQEEAQRAQAILDASLFAKETRYALAG